MISESDRATVYFNHKARMPLHVAGGCIDNIVRIGSLDDSDAETIDSAKYLFREFLQQIIDDHYPLPLPLHCQLSRIREAHQKSDFDWKDSKQYKEFQRWFCETF